MVAQYYNRYRFFFLLCQLVGLKNYSQNCIYYSETGNAKLVVKLVQRRGRSTNVKNDSVILIAAVILF